MELRGVGECCGFGFWTGPKVCQGVVKHLLEGHVYLRSLVSRFAFDFNFDWLGLNDSSRKYLR